MSRLLAPGAGWDERTRPRARGLSAPEALSRRSLLGEVGGGRLPPSLGRCHLQRSALSLFLLTTPKGSWWGPGNRPLVRPGSPWLAFDKRTVSTLTPGETADPAVLPFGVREVLRACRAVHVPVSALGTLACPRPFAQKLPVPSVPCAFPTSCRRY